ncbi:hypothetical protein O1L60_17035 [Streptomyces diastatochromogenes]|nr:hypothetical protein [Streptomyces diastatochromogenes]
MAVAMYQAVMLARKNQQRHERLVARRRKLDRHVVQEGAAQEERRRATYDRALVPFRDAFERLKRVDLAELAPVEPAGHATADVELREVQQLAVSAIGSVLGGGATGAGVGAATYMAVGAFATASTGTAISGLSGPPRAAPPWPGWAAVRSRRAEEVAAGTAVLAAAVAVPALLATGALLEWRGRSAREDQRKLAEELDGAEAELTAARGTLSEVFRLSREIRLVLKDLCAAMEERLPAFAELVAAHDDYGTYDARQRALVKEVFDLACTTVAVMGPRRPERTAGSASCPAASSRTPGPASPHWPRRMSRTFLPGAADQAAWTVADAATRRLAEATVETLRTRETVERLARRYADIGNAQRAGHLFEVRHALSFNQNAIRAGASVRAVVTEWAQGGSQTAAADLHLVDRDRLVGLAQAKLMDRVPATAHQMARPDYAGMTRLVAGDRVAAVDSLLERRLTMTPEGVRFADYADAHARLTDRLTHGGVSSDPIDLADAHRSARDPMRWARGEAVRTAGREAAAAAGTAAAVGGLVTGALSAAGQLARVRAGETSAAAAALTAASSAARAAARSGAVSGLGSVIRTASRAGRLPSVLGGGDLAFATAGAAYAVAEAGVALARGQIDPGEFAARSAEATLRTGLGWACGAVAQTVIPVPVVGALVGGLVGQARAP